MGICSAVVTLSEESERGGMARIGSEAKKCEAYMAWKDGKPPAEGEAGAAAERGGIWTLCKGSLPFGTPRATAAEQPTNPAEPTNGFARPEPVRKLSGIARPSGGGGIPRPGTASRLPAPGNR